MPGGTSYSSQWSALQEQVSRYQCCAAGGYQAQEDQQFNGKERRLAGGHAQLVGDPIPDWLKVQRADDHDAQRGPAEDRNRPLWAAGVRPHRQPYQAGTQGDRGSPQEDVSEDEAGHDDPAQSTDDDAHQAAPESRSPPHTGGHPPASGPPRPALTP